MKLFDSRSTFRSAEKCHIRLLMKLLLTIFFSVYHVDSHSAVAQQRSFWTVFGEEGYV